MPSKYIANSFNMQHNQKVQSRQNKIAYCINTCSHTTSSSKQPLSKNEALNIERRKKQQENHADPFCCANRLDFNPSKTESCVISHRRMGNLNPLSVDSVPFLQTQPPSMFW